ncbi:hypothetical protein M885DRAFT_507179 [Pelagophyceae sp. CCMP2097]|nr:hypothetical protein M885DRAFT_507179 [Pelagophyceae sp. CCMP2097]
MRTLEAGQRRRGDVTWPRAAGRRCLDEVRSPGVGGPGGRDAARVGDAARFKRRIASRRVADRRPGTAGRGGRRRGADRRFRMLRRPRPRGRGALRFAGHELPPAPRNRIARPRRPYRLRARPRRRRRRPGDRADRHRDGLCAVQRRRLRRRRHAELCRRTRLDRLPRGHEGGGGHVLAGGARVRDRRFREPKRRRGPGRGALFQSVPRAITSVGSQRDVARARGARVPLRRRGLFVFAAHLRRRGSAAIRRRSPLKVGRLRRLHRAAREPNGPKIRLGRARALGPRIRRPASGGASGGVSEAAPIDRGACVRSSALCERRRKVAALSADRVHLPLTYLASVGPFCIGAAAVPAPRFRRNRDVLQMRRQRSMVPRGHAGHGRRCRFCAAPFADRRAFGAPRAAGAHRTLGRRGRVVLRAAALSFSGAAPRRCSRVVFGDCGAAVPLRAFVRRRNEVLRGAEECVAVLRRRGRVRLAPRDPRGLGLWLRFALRDARLSSRLEGHA